MGNDEAAIKFLRSWTPGGPWALVAIQLDKKSIATVFTKNENEVKEFLSEYNGKRNIYFHVNPLIRKTKSKANKEDIREAVCLHVDIDPVDGKDWAKEHDRIMQLLTVSLPDGVQEPSVIIDSGGGFQAFWKLEVPSPLGGDAKACEEFELYNKRLEQVFKGDHCHNVDRIMRLPGTVNIPDDKKRAKGRIERLSTVLVNTDVKYSIDSFQKAELAFDDNSHPGGDYGIDVDLSGPKKPTGNLTDLDAWGVGDDVKMIIAQGSDPMRPLKGDNSRSAWLWVCITRLLEKGVPDRIIYDIVTDPKWPISESVLDKGNPDRYAKRQIKRAKEFGVNPDLMLMNEKYAVIEDLHGRCRVVRERYDSVMERTVLTVMDFADVHKAEDHRTVSWTDSSGKEHIKPKGKWWLSNPHRRQFSLMRFSPGFDEPGVYNMWRGFSYKPEEGDCSLYIDHIRNIICSGNETWFCYLIRWMAHCVQFPGQHGEVSIVLQGNKGTGKSLLATVFGSLFGRHFFHASDPGQVVGNFNAHLEDVIVLFADEAFFAGDRRQDQALKRIVTEKSLVIEPKGYDKRQCKSYIHLIIASNDSHVVRATGDERRYFILNVSSEKMQDRVYFGKMLKQMNEGGYEALLHYLLNIDLTDFDVGKPPKTEALKDQILRSLSPDDEWWFNKLDSARFFHDDGWPHEVFLEQLRKDYNAHMDTIKNNHRLNPTSLGKFLARVAPSLIKSKRRGTINGQRHEKYVLPPVEKLREEWDAIHSHLKWDDMEYEDLNRDDNPF